MSYANKPMPGPAGPAGPSGPPGGTTVTYWLHDDNSDVPLYKKLLTEPANDPIEDDMNVSVVHADGEKLLEHSHVTDPGFPGVTTIPAGTWTLVLYRNAEVGGVAAIVFRVYKRDLVGLETELFNFTTGIINESTVTRQVINLSQPAYTLAVTDRVVLRPLATNTQAFPVVVHMYHDGELHDSYLQIPALNQVTFDSVIADVDLTATAVTPIDARPAAPAGNGRWKLVSIELRVKVGVTGIGASATVRVGSTNGGDEIIKDQTVLVATPVGDIVGGLARASLGTDLPITNGYQAIYAAGQEIFVGVTIAGVPLTGVLTGYLVWQTLP